MSGRGRRRGFGHVRKLPSGRWQASFVADLRRLLSPVAEGTGAQAPDPGGVRTPAARLPPPGARPIDHQLDHAQRGSYLVVPAVDRQANRPCARLCPAQGGVRIVRAVSWVGGQPSWGRRSLRQGRGWCPSRPHRPCGCSPSRHDDTPEPGRAALPRTRSCLAPAAVDAPPQLANGARGRRATGPACARPAPHWSHHDGSSGGDPCRAAAASRPQLGLRGIAVPARGART